MSVAFDVSPEPKRRERVVMGAAGGGAEDRTRRGDVQRHARSYARSRSAVPTLTSKQRAHLRGLAHALKPLAHVGKEGVTPAAVRALQQTFDTHELVKVRVLEAAPPRRPRDGPLARG